MTIRQQWLTVLAVVMVLGGGLFAATHYLGGELFPVTVGSTAPDFRAVTLDSQPARRSLKDYKGQVVLLNIWGTFCIPCRVEMPSLEALHRQSKDLKIVAVSIDDRGQEASVRRFAKEYGLTFDILYDPTGDIEARYQTTGVPETFIIARDGTIRRKVIGASDWTGQTHRALITQLLSEPAR